MMRRIIALLVFTMLLTACQREAPETLFQLTGRIFVFNYRVSEASYMVTIAQVSPIADGMRIEATFDNPAGGPPIIITRPAWPKLKTVALASPPIRCVKAGVPYGVRIAVKDRAGQIVQTIETTVTSTIDQSVLAAKPLVVGPGYGRNPEVFGAGKPDFSPDADCPNLK